MTVDPEMRAEFEAQQKSGPMSALLGGGGGAKKESGFDMAEYLSGSGGSKTTSSVSGKAIEGGKPTEGNGNTQRVPKSSKTKKI